MSSNFSPSLTQGFLQKKYIYIYIFQNFHTYLEAQWVGTSELINIFILVISLQIYDTIIAGDSPSLTKRTASMLV